MGRIITAVSAQSNTLSQKTDYITTEWLSTPDFNDSHAQKRTWIKETKLRLGLHFSEPLVLEALAFNTDAMTGHGSPTIEKLKQSPLIERYSTKAIINSLNRLAKKGAITKQRGPVTFKDGRWTSRNHYVLLGYEFKLPVQREVSTTSLNSSYPSYINNNKEQEEEYVTCCNLNNFVEEKTMQVPEMVKIDAPPKYVFRHPDIIARDITLKADLINDIITQFSDEDEHDEIIFTLKALKCSESDKDKLFIDLLNYRKKLDSGKIRSLAAVITQQFKYRIAKQKISSGGDLMLDFELKKTNSFGAQANYAQPTVENTKRFIDSIPEIEASQEKRDKFIEIKKQDFKMAMMTKIKQTKIEEKIMTSEMLFNIEKLKALRATLLVNK